MKLIGVTGGVGSGKSEILQYMKRQYKCRILMADDAARALEAPGGAVYEPLVELLEEYGGGRSRSEKSGEELSGVEESCVDLSGGTHSGAEAAGKVVSGNIHSGAEVPCENILLPDGRINNPEMARRIFSSPELLEKVNALVHPAVKKYILDEFRKEEEAGSCSFFVVEAALLIECGYGEIVDSMWYIYCEPMERRRRLKASRGYSDEKIDSIMRSQLSEDLYRQNSDVVIDNSGALEDSCRQVDEAMRKMGEA